jgi:hypothetical protein
MRTVQIAVMALALVTAAQAGASMNISALDTGASTINSGTVDAHWAASLVSTVPPGQEPPGGFPTGSAYVVPNGTTYTANGGTYALVGPGPWVANDNISSWISYYRPPTLPDETADTMQ